MFVFWETEGPFLKRRAWRYPARSHVDAFPSGFPLPFCNAGNGKAVDASMIGYDGFGGNGNLNSSPVWQGDFPHLVKKRVHPIRL